MEWLDQHSGTVIGLIWMLVLGPAIGNYACSVVYRLPLGKTPFERHPFCGHCNTPLKPIDLFPIISYCMTGGICRYCGGPIPGIYTVIELACLALFVANFLVMGMGQQFLLTTTAGVFVIIAASIQHQQGWLSASIYSYAWAAYFMARTLQEGTIYPAIQGMVVAFVVALTLHALHAKLKKSEPNIATPWIWWAGMVGMVVPMGQWELFLVPLTCLLICAWCKEKRAQSVIVSWAGGVLMMPVLLS